MSFDFYDLQREMRDATLLSMTARTYMDANGADMSKANNEETFRTCMACRSKFEAHSMISVLCRHWWCGECLENRFRLSLKDETMFPPQCCYTIPLKEVQKWLPKALVREFRSKELELKTKNKTYCHQPACSAFIAPHSIHNDEAICQKCSASTCAKCRGKWHFGPCSAGDNAEFIEFANSNTWKRCPQCKRMVEKNDGEILRKVAQNETC